MGSHPIGLEAGAETNPVASLSTQTLPSTRATKNPAPRTASRTGNGVTA